MKKLTVAQARRAARKMATDKEVARKQHLATEASAQVAVSSTAVLADAVRYEIRVAEKQIALLKLRIEQDPRIAANVRPFGSNLWRMKQRLECALASANDQARPRGESAKLTDGGGEERRKS